MVISILNNTKSLSELMTNGELFLNGLKAIPRGKRCSALLIDQVMS